VVAPPLSGRAVPPPHVAIHHRPHRRRRTTVHERVPARRAKARHPIVAPRSARGYRCASLRGRGGGRSNGACLERPPSRPRSCTTPRTPRAARGHTWIARLRAPSATPGDSGLSQQRHKGTEEDGDFSKCLRPTLCLCASVVNSHVRNAQHAAHESKRGGVASALHISQLLLLERERQRRAGLAPHLDAQSVRSFDQRDRRDADAEVPLDAVQHDYRG